MTEEGERHWRSGYQTSPCSRIETRLPGAVTTAGAWQVRTGDTPEHLNSRIRRSA